MSKKRNRSYRFPQTLRELMKNHPDTGEITSNLELAEYLHVSAQSVSQYTTGKTIPIIPTIFAIADFFDVSVDYLLTGTEDYDVYFTTKEAHKKRLLETYKKIAVFCSNAENLALNLMESEAPSDVQE